MAGEEGVGGGGGGVSKLSRTLHTQSSWWPTLGHTYSVQSLSQYCVASSSLKLHKFIEIPVEKQRRGGGGGGTEQMVLMLTLVASPFGSL